MLVLSRSEVERLLDLDRLRQTIANAMADLSAGRVSMPSRIAAMVPERDALLAAMPAYLPSSGALATKLVSLFPRNTDRPTHQAVIVVFDANNGSPLALMDGEAITAARTAAASALATDLLARKDAQVLAVIGTGVQARAHLRAVPRVREFREVRVAGRHGDKAMALVSFCAEQGQAMVRFDYSGHGSSGGQFEDGTIGQWAEDALAVIDHQLTANRAEEEHLAP